MPETAESLFEMPNIEYKKVILDVLYQQVQVSRKFRDIPRYLLEQRVIEIWNTSIDRKYDPTLRQGSRSSEDEFADYLQEFMAMGFVKRTLNNYSLAYFSVVPRNQ